MAHMCVCAQELHTPAVPPLAAQLSSPTLAIARGSCDLNNLGVSPESTHTMKGLIDLPFVSSMQASFGVSKTTWSKCVARPVILLVQERSHLWHLLTWMDHSALVIVSQSVWGGKKRNKRSETKVGISDEEWMGEKGIMENLDMSQAHSSGQPLDSKRGWRVCKLTEEVPSGRTASALFSQCSTMNPVGQFPVWVRSAAKSGH
jgi:hypothetical protein